ncbi:peptide ABC transporter permease [Bacillus songklensis]|uniref:Peptide ABC transporter permease n=1 Tax=Bacillus songklensis TaxID=1069116 RepID=A0ABV8B341_9BACI
MSKTDGIRDLIYINGNLNERFFITYGIEFKEFVYSIPSELSNILLLKHQFDESDFHFGTLLDYVEREQIDKLAQDNVYGYGNFCWIDVEELSSLDLLEPHDLAALLYLGHYQKPLHSPFNNKLNNQFVYLAHDDGRFNKTYYRDVYDMKHLMSRIVPLKISSLNHKRFSLLRKKSEYPALPLVLVNTLLTLTNDGLLLDFQHMGHTRRDIQIPVYTIGEFLDMDEMYNDLEEHKRTSKLKANLILNKKDLEWSLIES